MRVARVIDEMARLYAVKLEAVPNLVFEQARMINIFHSYGTIGKEYRGLGITAPFKRVIQPRKRDSV